MSMIKTTIKTTIKTNRERRLPRRTFLRGLGGAVIALPILDIMLDEHGQALADQRPIPRRFLVAFNGQSLGADGDKVHNLYAPDTIGPNYDLKAAVEPLAKYDNIRDQISIVSGLRMPYGTDPIPAGGWASGFHIQALGPLISGVRNSSVDDNGVNGPSADQIVAAQIGKPKAVRAMGRANATNPMPIIIPCHRVLGSDGKLHGYGGPGGLETKAWLLKLEGAWLL